MFKSIKNYLIRKWLKRYEKGPWPIIIDLSLLVLIIIIASYGINRFKKPEAIVFPPTNNQISKNIEAENIDLTKSMIEVSFAWKNGLIDRESKKDYLKLNLKNTAEYNVRNVKISFVPSDDSIIKEGSDVIEIGALASGEEKSLEHLIEIETDKKTLSTDIKAVIEYEVFGKKIKAEVNVPELKIEAFIEASAFALYTTPQGDKLGLGPLPPVVDEPTNYWAFFETMALGDISDFTLKANLSEETDFLDNYSLLSGNLNYTSDNKEITWHIPLIKAGEDKYRLGIEIMFLPTEDQLGKSPVMLKNIRYFAIDNNSQLEISGRLNDITTDIKQDFSNPDSGKVKEASL